MPHVLTTCPFCGCGCGLYLQVAGRKLLGATASAGHPVGRGRLCAKGWHAHEVATSARRLRKPLIRRNSAFEEASWDEALSLVADRVGAIKADAGGSAIGVLGSPRATNEENFLLAKLARRSLETNNIDFSARLDALPGLFDLPKYRHLTLSAAGLDDIDRADLIFLWQADPVEEHPAAASRVLRAAERGVPVVEVAVRSGQLGELAEIRLSPRPGTELQLAAGLLHVALAKAEAAEVESLAATVANWTPDQTEATTGVPASDVIRVGEALSACRAPLVIYTRAASLGPQGADVLAALSAFGKAATASTASWSPLLWLGNYCNFQGARDMGVTPYFLAGYQPVSDEAVRSKFGRAWGVSIPVEAGLPSWDMLGRAKALFVMGDDPLANSPDVAAARDALSKLDFIAVQDIFLTPTAQMAHVVLPGSSFAEKEGTFTNTERRVQRVRRAVDSPGEARADWEILCELSRRLGRPIEYDSPAQIMAEISSLVPIYSHISHERLDEGWGVRWSLDGALAADRAALGAEQEEGPTSVAQSSAPALDEEFQFTLVADHVLGAWKTDTFVANAIGLRRQQGADRAGSDVHVEISRADAQKLELREGSRVKLRSRNGEMEAEVRISDAVRAGVLVLPAAMREAASVVLPPTADAESGVPLLRPAAVSIEKA